MDFAFSAEQEAFREQTRRFLASEVTSKRVRAASDWPDACDTDLWEKCREQGWMAIGIPEAYGGAGTFLDLAVLMEEAGRHLLPGPWFGTMALAVPLILEAGSAPQKAAVLGAIAAGDAVASLAMTETGGWAIEDVTLQASYVGSRWRLTGVKRFVPDADRAKYIIVVARTAGAGADGITLFLVPRDTPGLAVRHMATLDRTRSWCEVQLADVALDQSHVLGEVESGGPALQRALAWGRAALCAEMIGGMSWILDTAVEYAKVREQFGKPIGIYQAVSHRLASSLVQLESSRSAAYYAAWAVDTNADDRELATTMAKAYVSDAYRQAAWTGIQTLGGIGFTWEHDMQLYFKRAKASEVLLGDGMFHRERVATMQGF